VTRWREGGEARSDPDDAGGKAESEGRLLFISRLSAGGALARAPPRRRPDLICVRAWSLLLRPFAGGRLDWAGLRAGAGLGLGWDGRPGVSLADGVARQLHAE
jgi:hypothetical protein